MLSTLGTDVLDAAALARRLHMRRRTIEETLRALLAAGRLRRLGAGQRSDPYRYTV